MFVRRIRPEILIAIIALVIAACWLPIRMRFPFDDTYITFRYAANLAHGFGIVWNPGGPHTEGYTNFLLVLLLAPFSAMGWDLVAVSQAIGVIAVMVSATAIWKITNYELRITNEGPNPNYHHSSFIVRHCAGALAVALFLLDPFTWMNAYSGLETSLFTMWLLLAMWAFFRRGALEHRISVAFALATLATLTRPEGALMGMILLLVGMVSDRSTTNYELPHTTDHARITNGKKIILYWIVAFVLPLLFYAGWKLWYFGNLLPNSFYIKVAQASGLFPGRGTLRIFYEGVWYLVLLALYALWKERDGRRLAGPVPIAAWWCVLLSVFYLCSELLQAQYGRFTNSIEVLLLLLAAIGMTRLIERVRFPRALLVTLLGFHLVWNLFMRHGLSLLEDTHPYERAYLRIARVFHSVPDREDITFAWSDAGILPYYSGMQNIDMVGLNTNAIAHAHLTSEVVRTIAQSRPDLVIIPIRNDSLSDLGGRIFHGGHGLIGEGFGMLLDRPELASYKPIALLPVFVYDLDLLADTTSPHYRDIVNTIVPRIGRDSDFEAPVKRLR